MKYTIFLILMLLVFYSNSSCKRNQPKISVQNRDSVIMVLSETEFNFGQIKSGEVVKHTFSVTNKGNNDLLIYRVLTTCGCTVAAFETKPIRPGEKGSIIIQFDSAGKSGQILKIATIVSNSLPSNQDLKIVGYIID